MLGGLGVAYRREAGFDGVVVRREVLDSADAELRTCEERDYKGLHSFPSNVTRDDPPTTRDYPSLPSNITREVTH